MQLTKTVITDLNTITDWLVIDDFSCNNTIKSDLMIMAGHAVIPTIVGAINFAITNSLAMLFSGGIGHSTELLKQAIQKNTWLAKQVNYSTLTSEAAIFLEIAASLADISNTNIYLEDKSTNCGLNARFSLELLDQKNNYAQDIILVQDPLMQRRTFESFKYASQQKKRTYNFINWPVFKPTLTLINGKVTIIGAQIAGVWEVEHYIAMVLGEIKRLRDDSTGYGPVGSGFIGHVDIPVTVETAWQRLMHYSALATLIR